MKTKIENYSFSKSSKTITFTNYTSIRLDALLLITNVTDNIILYNFADPNKGVTVIGNVLTLIADTSAMDDADKLLIYYDDVEAIQGSSISDLIYAIKNLIIAIANPSYVDKSANQMRAQVTGSVAVSGSLTTAGTVSTVTTLSNIDGYQGKQVIIAENINAWSNTVRNKIT
jgi:hypothetical protein